MTATNDWNASKIEEFRANGGRLGGPFEGATMTLLHHRGRKSGTEYVSPLMYLAADDDPATIYVFASKGGHPSHPDWYHNAVSAGDAVVEVGTETYRVKVIELQGDERDRIFAIQKERFPGFAEYEEKTAGIREIPVLALHRE